MATPRVSDLGSLLHNFHLAYSDELTAAMFSALHLLSPKPLIYEECLCLLLRYEPQHPDPSLVLRVRGSDLYTFQEMQDAFTPGGHWGGSVLPPSKTVSSLKALATSSVEWHTLPHNGRGRPPLGQFNTSLVLIAVQEDATGKCIHSQTLTIAMTQMDLRGSLGQLHPSVRLAFTDANWKRNFIVRSQVSNLGIVEGSKPPMSPREAARFKGVSTRLFDD
ncbi:hypothetical protein P7C70_g657, partial [Phenoliferia sp. Uapishka_3]